MPSKYAVLIGINTYPHYGEDQQLSGCVNDAKRMKQVLVEHFGFLPENIWELHDAAASRQGILNGMNWLVDVADADDVVVFHYSGHGRRRLAKLRKNTELRPTDGEWFDKSEGTRYDSTLMPADTGPRPYPHLDITDNTINAWLTRLTAKTSNVTLVFDACHSGTVTRSADDRAEKDRTLPADDRDPEPAGQAEASDNPGKVAKKGRSGWLPLCGDYTVFSGSRDSETSKEMNVSGGSPFNRHGLLTYFLTQALTETVPGTTHRDVFEVVGRSVNDRNPRQHPQIEGSLDREIFGRRIIRPMRYVTVDSVEERRVMLRAGAMLGMTAGTTVNVYPPGTRQAEETPVTGRLEIVDVGPLSSEAKTIGSAEGLVAGSRAVPEETTAGIFEQRLGLGNPASAIRADLVLYRVLPNGELEPAGSPGFAFDEGDRVAFKLINSDATALFATVLNFDMHGNIRQLYPRRSRSEMIAGSREVLVGAQRAKLRVHLRGLEGDSGRQYYKAFFATRPIDLSWLCVEARPAEDQKPPNRGRQMSARPQTRSAKEDEALADREDWMNVTRTVVVRRRTG